MKPWSRLRFWFRRPQFDRDLADDEQHFVFAFEFAIGKAKVSQPFGAGALEEFDVLRVIDHAAGIGVLKVNALRKIEGEKRGLLGAFKR